MSKELRARVLAAQNRLKAADADVSAAHKALTEATVRYRDARSALYAAELEIAQSKPLAPTLHAFLHALIDSPKRLYTGSMRRNRELIIAHKLVELGFVDMARDDATSHLFSITDAGRRKLGLPVPQETE